MVGKKTLHIRILFAFINCSIYFWLTSCMLSNCMRVNFDCFAHLKVMTTHRSNLIWFNITLKCHEARMPPLLNAFCLDTLPLCLILTSSICLSRVRFLGAKRGIRAVLILMCGGEYSQYCKVLWVKINNNILMLSVHSIINPRLRFLAVKEHMQVDHFFTYLTNKLWGIA